MEISQSELDHLYSDNPPQKVAFQVVLEFNSEHDQIKGHYDTEGLSQCSEYLGTFSEARESAIEAVQFNHEQFPNTRIVDVEQEYGTEEAMDSEADFALIDNSGEPVMVAHIVIMDYRTETIH